MYLLKCCWTNKKANPSFESTYLVIYVITDNNHYIQSKSEIHRCMFHNCYTGFWLCLFDIPSGLIISLSWFRRAICSFTRRPHAACLSSPYGSCQKFVEVYYRASETRRNLVEKLSCTLFYRLIWLILLFVYRILNLKRKFSPQKMLCNSCDLHY